MDYKFMEHITDLQIQREIDDRMARDAIRQKQIQDAKDKRETAIFITGLVLCGLWLAF